ncbi:Vps54-domain-containing protein [Linderina pennispora]|uniref:Vps54-domain-containing protein n=1 Tax=Linderina pennispora TaxID=61395 RepID=A0A1Y1WKY1_9FUNG|nr:Vps54-domain-containing protein [Linderina pennispora]ORX74152.1 Vps54-domain-containing protein [Linderina pennispora]
MKRHSGIGIIRNPGDGRGERSQTTTRQRQQGLAASARTDSSSEKDKPDTASTVAMTGANAIAVLTSNPNKVPSRIHRNELPVVAKTHYPRAKSSEFDRYLESISGLFDQYAMNARTGYQIATDELERYEAAVEDAEKVLEAASHTYSMDSTTMAERLRALDGYAQREQFDLSDPATFDIVTQVVLGPQLSTELLSAERAAMAGARMQETLSGYMDTVEGYLTREISRRSPSFFAALSTLEDLHKETDRCIAEIHGLRGDLRRTAHAQCAPGLELIRLRRRRDNLAAVLRDVELLGRATASGALNLIVEAQEMVEPAQRAMRSGQGKPGVAATRAFRALDARLTRALSSVSEFAERELASTLLRDMREFVDDGLSRAGQFDSSQVGIYQANLGLQLSPLVLGLARIGGVAGALRIYRDHLMAETAELIEGLYPHSFPRSHGHAMFNDATQQRSLNAAVRALTFDQFRSLLGQQQQLLLLIITHIGMSALDGSAHYAVAKGDLQRSLDETFETFMDVAHVRCAKLVNHRSEQNARLSLAGFYALYAEISQFVAQYEQLCGKMCFGLRGTLTAQGKGSRQIHILIENEQWVQAEVPIDFQNLVNQVVEAAGQQTATEPTSPLVLGAGTPGISTPGIGTPRIGTPGINTPASGPLALSSGQTSSESPLPSKALDGRAFEGVHTQMVMATKAADSDVASVRSVDTAGIGLMHIGGESFHVVGCSLVLVKSVVEYLQCAVNIPVLVTDVLQRLVEVFKAFNSRTCQVVLGAGAMRSAGLKNISAKHLALASESLGLCMELLPYVKECLRHVMSSTQAGLLGQLDRAVGDFANHQHELHRKLVQIMADRGDYHCRMLGATKWDSAAAVPAPAIDGLAKEVRKLHRVLKRYLPEAAVRWVFGQIFAMYGDKLTAQYARLRITTAEGKRQLLANSQYLLKNGRQQH